MIAACIVPVFAVEQIKDGGAVSIAPLSQEYVKYQQSMSSHRSLVSAAQPEIENGSGHAMGLIPRRMDFSYLAGSDVSDALLNGDNGENTVAANHTMVGLPASYDLRQTGKLTAVRDQSTSGSCWAFATYASLESYLRTGETRDFSENNMKNTAGFDLDPNLGGGNDIMSTAYLVRWSGPVNEATDPFNPASTTSSSFTPVKHVQDVLYLPPRATYTDNDNIKSAIMTYGAVYTTIRYDGSYYNGSSHSYYYSGLSSINHAVAIVGWDDNYSKNNFTSVPSSNGAFIVRNSWAATWGDAGYFYISYYDTKIGKDNTVFEAEPTYNYDHIYQYDWLGWVSTIGNGADTGYLAANYVSTGEQLLEATGFYTAAVNSEYQIKVYRGGVLMQTTSGTIAVPGYHTVRLDTSVPLAGGQAFRIEVRLRTPGYGFPITVEYADSGYSSRAVQNDSETFYSINGATWYDAANLLHDTSGGIPDASVCLKAYTQDPYSTVGFSQLSYTAAENAGAAVITVTRDRSSSSCSVDYDAVRGNATASDFTPVSGTLSFNVGETSKTFSVPILDDHFLEGDETVSLLIANSVGNTHIGQSSATLTITDNELVPSPMPTTLAFATSESDGSLSVIDVASNTVIAALELGVGAHDVAVSPGGAFAYVTDNSTGQLRVFSARNLSLLQSVPVGSHPQGISVSLDGSMAAVANSGANTASLVDLHALTLLHTVSVGQSPEAVAFSPDGSKAYAVNKAGGSVSIINAGSGAVSSTITVGSSPKDVAVAPDGRAYITNYGSNSISVINGAQVTTVSMTGQPQDIAISPDGNHAYVSFPGSNKIDVLSLPGGAVERSITTASPGSIGLSADGQKLYAARSDNKIITVFQVPGGSAAGTITAGESTTGIAIGPSYLSPVVEFSSASYSVTRSNADLTITLERDGCIDTPLSVNITATGGNATAGVDYVALPATLEIPQGASEATFSLTILNSGSTGDRTLGLTLTNPDGAQTGTIATTTINIVEDRMVSVTLDLAEGWNLISLPLIQENYDISTGFPADVKAGIMDIWGWDESAQEWVYYSPDPNDYFYQYYPHLTSLNTGKAYWIEMNKSATLTINGVTPGYAPSSQVSTDSGWSLVGSTGVSTNMPVSLHPQAKDIWGWDESAQEWVYYSPDPNDYFYQYYPKLENINPGHGYWVEMA